MLLLVIALNKDVLKSFYLGTLIQQIRGFVKGINEAQMLTTQLLRIHIIFFAE